MSIETALVYIHALLPRKRFIGCGALIEGPAIVTCRHVWEAAVKLAGREDIEVDVEYPYAHETRRAALLDRCVEADELPPDALLLTAQDIPDQAMSLQLAPDLRFVHGPGYSLTGILGREKGRPDRIAVIRVPSTISDLPSPEDRHEFTGVNRTNFWFAHCSSGSPMFRDGGIQLAGIVSLSETGDRPGEAELHEAFIVPATTIRRHLILARARRAAVESHIPAAALQSLLAEIGAPDVPIAEIATRLRAYVDDLSARAATPVSKSNGGADIDAAIGAARGKLRTLDAAGARSILAAKIAEEEAERQRRIIPLLEEQAAIERLSFDYDAAKATLTRLLALDPERVWHWIDLGDLWVTTGSLDEAARAFRGALAAAERLMRADPGNAGWQRDLSVSHNKIGEVQEAQADLAAALTSYRASLAIRKRLAQADPGNAGWQRDLSVSHDRIGDVQQAQGDLAAALTSYRASLAIIARLRERSPDNATLPQDLAYYDAQIAALSK